MDGRLLPFFSDYRKGQGWPDGRRRIDQPVKLAQAFDLLTYWFDKYETQLHEQRAADLKRESLKNAQQTRSRTTGRRSRF
jgi:hypothetical protein